MLNEWIDEKDMTDQEKIDHPNFYVCGGYLKTFGYKDACGNMWEKLSDEEKKIIQEIPNFDADNACHPKGTSMYSTPRASS